ncbi:MAG TPA: DNA alkylation repair protein [Candidatus Limnocylindrales bacterium]|nr:DNA alkylation repair protein [Candidatus Limnocylindrales bacterium]
MTSEATLRAQAFVAEHLPEARGLGDALADLIDEPEAFVDVLREGLERLADDVYAREQERVAPGSGVVFGVRGPLLAAVTRQLRKPLAESSAASALWLADRLVVEPEREIELVGYAALRRSLPDDPERTWQLMRRLGHAATDWIRVDTLAELFAQGVLLEPFRWAELEQLVYAASRWERRLVGSTVARLPFELAGDRRRVLKESPGLTLIKSLLGDAEPDVQKALSWALRSWLEVDPRGVREFIRAEAEAARQADDGHRAWVLRDALSAPSIEPTFAAEIRQRLEGIRRRADQPSSSEAATVAAGFTGLQQMADAAVDQQGYRQQMAPLGGRR